jgi:hypothetical protein
MLPEAVYGAPKSSIGISRCASLSAGDPPAASAGQPLGCIIGLHAPTSRPQLGAADSDQGRDLCCRVAAHLDGAWPELHRLLGYKPADRSPASLGQ